MKIIKEFKTFAMRGNVIDMAVGVIIGGAFGKIVSSLVNDIIMPPIGVLIGGVKFTDLSIVIKEAVPASVNNLGQTIPEVSAVTINYGNFLQVVFDFLIIVFVIFMMIKMMNRLKKKEEETPAPPAQPTKQELLLTEIRDLLKK